MTADETQEMRQLRVLIVDDADEMRMLIRFVLKSSDRFNVVGEAVDGADAVEKARDLQPDLVLLDLSMPGMDGLEAMPLLLDVAPKATIVVLSGYRKDVMAQKALESGAIGYIEKGMKPKELLDSLADLLLEGA